MSGLLPTPTKRETRQAFTNFFGKHKDAFIIFGSFALAIGLIGPKQLDCETLRVITLMGAIILSFSSFIREPIKKKRKDKETFEFKDQLKISDYENFFKQ